MSNLIFQAKQQVEAALQDGLAQCRGGRHRDGCLNPDSVAGKTFETAYENWMRLRAAEGDKFALSLGYGRTPLVTESA